jgi:beta-glucosidase-like glycosyl hydrolase
MPAATGRKIGFDPYLQGIPAGKTTNGIQGNGVVATAECLADNEQERFRLLKH